MSDEAGVGRVHRVEASSLPESFDGEQYLVALTFVSVCVAERDRAFSVLDYRDIGIGSDFKSSNVVGELHRRGRFGGAECNRIIDREAEVDVL